MKDLSETCAVINALVGADGPLNARQIREITQIEQKAVNSILPRLDRQGRVLVERKKGEANLYRYNESHSWTSKRGNQPGRRPRSRRPRRNVEQKILFLRRLQELSGLSDESRALVASMLEDYGATP